MPEFPKHASGGSGGHRPAPPTNHGHSMGAPGNTPSGGSSGRPSGATPFVPHAGWKALAATRMAEIMLHNGGHVYTDLPEKACGIVDGLVEAFERRGWTK